MYHLTIDSWKIFIVFIAAFFICNFQNASSQANHSGIIHVIKTHITRSGDIESEPGKIVTIPIRIENISQIDQEIFEDMNLPDGWKLVLKSSPFLLKPRKTKTVIIAFLIPRQCLAGDYIIQHTLHYTDSINEVENKLTNKFRIKVLPTYDLEIVPLSKSNPLLVMAGETYIAKYDFVNKGNISQEIILDVTDSLGFPLFVNQDTIQLKAGESKVIEISVQTSSELTQSETDRISVFAMIKNSEGEKQPYYNSNQFQIIPQISGNRDSFHRIPSQLSLEYQQNKEMEISLTGNGVLTGTGENQIQYSLSMHPFLSKDLSGNDFHWDAEKDDFFFCLKNQQDEKIEFSSGNNIIQINSLLDKSIFENGSSIHYQNKDTSIGFCHTGKNEQEKGYVLSIGGYPFQNDWKIHLDYINTTIEPEKGENRSVDSKESNIIGIELIKDDFLNEIFPSEQSIFDVSSFHLSYARENTGAEARQAFTSQFRGRIKSFQFSFASLLIDPNFPGRNHDISSQNLNLSQSLGKHLSLKLSYRNQEQLSVYNIARFKSLSLNYCYDEMSAMIQYSNRLQHSELLSGENQKEDCDSLMLSFWHRSDNQYLHAFYQLNHVNSWNENKKSVESENRMYLSAGLYPEDNQKYELSYYAESDRLLRFDQDKILTFSGQYPLNHGNIIEAIGCLNHKRGFETSLNINLGFEHKFNEEFSLKIGEEYEVVKEQSNREENLSPYIGIEYHHEFSNQGQIELRGIYTFCGGDSGHSDFTHFKRGVHSLEVQYQIPFGMPIGKKRDSGIIKGSIFDIEKPDCPGLKGIIVQLNHQTTITDRQGNFVFYGLSEGQYYLSLDYSSLEEDNITVVKTPLEIKLKLKEKKEIKIGITKKAAIKGRIVCYDFLSGRLFHENNLVNKGGVADIYLELMNTENYERTKVLSDYQGNFIFSDLRPGEYRLIIPEECLPEFHYLDNKTDIIYIKPGETKEYNIRILPKKRNIQMIENDHHTLTIDNLLQ